jgi:hypothetical protein
MPTHLNNIIKFESAVTDGGTHRRVSKLHKMQSVAERESII